MKRLCFALVVLLLAAGLVGPHQASAAGEDMVPTTFTMMIGHPMVAVPREPTVTIMPGSAVEGEATSDRMLEARVMRVMEISKSFHLRDLHSVEPATLKLGLNRAENLPVWVGSLSIEATLTNFDDATATYRVRLSDGDKLLSEPEIMVRRGQDAIIGGRDGDAAPYFFLFIEPFEKGREVRPVEKVTQPLIVHKVQPEYPPDARAARIQGVVILEAQIDSEGKVAKVRALRPLPMGMTDAAIAAVSQWRYEPARDANGKAVAMPLVVTISFSLPEEDKSENK